MRVVWWLVALLLRHTKSRFVNFQLILALRHGTSFNAVKTRIWIAISVYLLVAIAKKRLKSPGSLSTPIQILEVSLFEKTDMIQLVNKSLRQQNIDDAANQLNLFGS